ncbi:MAG: tryptophan 7-halogenase [Lysobacterales bacterium]
MSRPEKLKDVIIVGGELWGWVVAAVLGRRLGKSGVKIHLVEDPQTIVTPGSLTTLPVAKFIHQQLGFSEEALISRCDGQVVFATGFHHWVDQGQRFCLGQSQCGSMINGVDFHHFLARLHNQGESVSLEDYSIAVHAARQAQQRSGVSIPVSGLDAAHSLNLHPGKYRQLLRDTALKAGVEWVQAKPVQITRHAERGHVETLVLANGSECRGDFFFDCSGTGRWLMGQLDAGWRCFPGLPSFDRTSSGHCDRQPDGALNTVTWQPQGWSRKIPLAGSETVELQYPGCAMSTADVEQWISDQLPHCTINHRSLQPGALAKPWQGNCVAIGGAGGFAGDALVPETAIWQKAISLWLDLYPDSACDPVLARCYNRVINTELERVAEVHALLSSHARKQGVWADGQVTGGGVDESGRRRATVFERIGRVPMGESEVLTAGAWAALLTGLGIWPNQYDPLADLIEPAELGTLLKQFSTQSAESARDQLAGVRP